ncbi:MAG: class B sortase [Ruminococcus sp.]
MEESNKNTVEEEFDFSPEEKKKKNKVLWWVIFALSTTAVVLCVAFIVFNTLSGSKGEDNYKELSTKVTPTLTDDHKPKKVEKSGVNPIDFEKLQKENKDIVGWIRIKGTNIDYPVLRAPASDESYYLHRDYTGSYLYAGSIYMESYNQPDFSDRDTILYGHNMMNGTMFADLHKFEDSSFFSKHKYFYIYTPDSIKKYLIYSAYEYDDRHINNSYKHFEDVKMFKEYIDYSLNPKSAIVSNVRVNSKVTVKDKLVTLSTCTNNRPENRFLVQGVLIEDETTK